MRSRVSLAGAIARAYVRRLAVRAGRDALYDLPSPKASETAFAPPAGVDYTVVYAGGVPIERFTRADSPRGKAILQLHGGGYVEGTTNARRRVALRYLRLSGGVTVVMPDYRIAPQHTHPAALQDALAAWDWLLENGYRAENTAIASDSAGGGLALSLVQALRDARRPVPAALYAMSPWADLSCSGASHESNFYRDAMFGHSEKKGHRFAPGARAPLYADGSPLDDPSVSPLFGCFKGFPPMLLQAGSYEILLSDSVAVYEKAKAQGCECILSIYEGMFHAFQFGNDRFPESRGAWREGIRFILKHLKMEIGENT